MRIAEYKKVSEELIEREIIVDDFDDDGNVIGNHTETITETKPVMSMVYREETEEEKKAREEAEANMPIIEEETTIADVVEALNIVMGIVLGEE